MWVSGLNIIEEKVVKFGHCKQLEIDSKKQVSFSIISLFPRVCLSSVPANDHQATICTCCCSRGCSSQATHGPCGSHSPEGKHRKEYVHYFASITLIFSMQVGYHHGTNCILRDMRHTSETSIGALSSD